MIALRDSCSVAYVGRLPQILHIYLSHWRRRALAACCVGTSQLETQKKRVILTSYHRDVSQNLIPAGPLASNLSCGSAYRHHQDSGFEALEPLYVLYNALAQRRIFGSWGTPPLGTRKAQS